VLIAFNGTATRRFSAEGYAGEQHLCQTNMPNVRIALAICAAETHLCIEAVRPRAARRHRDGKPVMSNDPPPRKPLSPAALRALAEAEARRAAARSDPRPKELQGPKGPEPTRYGDWENKGIASDF
jgi:hypothetical protein